MTSTKHIKVKSLRIRVIIFGLMFSLLFIAIGVKSAYLQVYRGPWLSEKAANQYEKSFKSSGKRGTIYDRNLREMAVSINATSIAAHPRYIDDPKIAAKLLSNALDIDYNALYQKLSSKSPFVWIKRHVSPKEETAVRDSQLQGIVFKSEYSRFYPNKTLAAQVLGFTGTDGHGLEGVEFSYDTYLKGANTHLTVLKDALGRRFDAKQASSPDLGGNNIVLTIDCTIQYIAEKALEEAVTNFSAKSGIALVMDPKTGALLALAHYPFFNPNSFRKYKREIWRNRTITDSFEPGSTMKIFSAATAIETGICTPDTIFFCENGRYRIGKNVVHDAANHAYGWLSLQQVIKFSSNIGAVKIEELIGSESLYKGLRDFGFGEKANIDCLGETTGSLSYYKGWSRIDAGTISFGQGISVSAIQLITAASVISNNGILMKPYLVQAITDCNGRLIKKVAPQPVRRVVSEKTAQVIKAIMKTVVDSDGTGTNAALEGYPVCGKTGTAQKIGTTGTYEKGKYVSSFIGFVPLDNPVLTILVIVDEPRNRHYGGTVAAPAFKKIAHETLDYLNIPPTPKTDIYAVSWEEEVSG